MQRSETRIRASVASHTDRLERLDSKKPKEVAVNVENGLPTPPAGFEQQGRIIPRQWHPVITVFNDTKLMSTGIEEQQSSPQVIRRAAEFIRLSSPGMSAEEISEAREILCELDQFL